MSFSVRPLAAAIGFAFSSLALSTPATAQTLGEITVSAERDKSAGSTTQLDAAELRQRGARNSDVASLLQEVPGVSFYGAGAVSSLPVIHGLADDRLRIKVDGMDFIAACPNHMNPALSYLDPSQVGTLTVFAGISPVSVGGDSIGGSIVAETRAPEFAAPGERLVKGEVGAFYRSNNDARGVNASATVASDSLSLSYTGAYSAADNYSAGSNFKNYTATGRAGHRLDRDEVGSTGYQTGNHTLGLAFRNANHLFEAKLGYQDMPEQLYPNQRMDLLDNEQKRINLRWLGDYDWGADGSPRLSRDRRSLHGLRRRQALLVRSLVRWWRRSKSSLRKSWDQFARYDQAWLCLGYAHENRKQDYWRQPEGRHQAR